LLYGNVADAIGRRRSGQSMIPKSGYRFSEKIMLKQKAGARPPKPLRL
jgi:hypothetical protein